MTQRSNAVPPSNSSIQGKPALAFVKRPVRRFALLGGVGVVIAELDLAAQAEARRNFPALTHRLM